MAQPDFSSVDDYLDAQPPAARRLLRRVRTVLRQTLPTAEESISYKIPTYTLPGGPVIYFAGWKDHLSLYPVTEEDLAAVAAPLKKIAGKLRVEKGTLRLSYEETLPVHLISHLAQRRAAQVAAKQAATKQAAIKQAATKPKRPATATAKPAERSVATKPRGKRAKGTAPRSTAAKPPAARAARAKAAAPAARAARSAAKAKPAAARAKAAAPAARAKAAAAKARPAAVKRR